MKKIGFYLLLTLFLGTVSCVRDTGNYVYIDVNELHLALPRQIRVVLENTTVMIEPEFTQTMMPDASNLRFAWRHSYLSVHSASRSETIISTDQNLAFPISTLDTRLVHHFWLEVTDLTTDIVYPFVTTLIVTRPFLVAWTVLHSNGLGSQLGAIQWLSDQSTSVHHDVRAEFGLPALTGAPVALGQNAFEQAVLPPEGFFIPENDRQSYAPPVHNLMFMFTTNPEESGILSPGHNFADFIPGVNVPRMLHNFSSVPFDMSKITYINRPNAGGGALINDGRLFHTRNGMKWYQARINPTLSDVRIDHALRVGRIAIMFDGIGRRFLWYTFFSPIAINNVVGNFRQVEADLMQIEALDRPANEFPLNDIQHQVLHIGIGNRTSYGTYQHIRSFAIANGANSQTFIYLFPTTHQIAQSSANRSIEEIRVINTPAGLDENSHFASSVAYANIVFFSSGSTIYRLDFSTGLAEAIYTHPGGGEIAAMRIARQEPIVTGGFIHDVENYGHPINRSLGVAINRGVGGELVILNLTEAGTVLNTQVFGGFGTIRDIHFVCDRRR